MCQDALIVWCLSWSCRWSFRSSFATLRPELMPSLILMFWAPCCNIAWTLRTASCLQRGCFTPVTPTGFCSFRSCLYCGPLLDTTLFRGCVALFCMDYRWSSDAIQWSIRGTDTVHREYRSDCEQNSGGSVVMESSGPRVKFQSGYRRGGSVLRGGNDRSSFCYSLHYGASPLATG